MSRYLVSFVAQYNEDIPNNPVAVIQRKEELDLELKWNGWDVPELKDTLRKYAKDLLKVGEYTEMAIVIKSIFELKRKPYEDF